MAQHEREEALTFARALGSLLGFPMGLLVLASCLTLDIPQRLGLWGSAFVVLLSLTLLVLTTIPRRMLARLYVRITAAVCCSVVIVVSVIVLSGTKAPLNVDDSMTIMYLVPVNVVESLLLAEMLGLKTGRG